MNPLFVLLGTLGAAALAAIAARARRDDPATADAEALAVAAFVDPLRAAFAQASDLATDSIRGWTPPAAAAPYLDRIATVSEARGVPAELIARVLYQESRFRADIISGAKLSSAGAIGIGQFLPDTAAELEIDPLDTDQAIDGVARYLVKLRDRFGSWSDAVAAYNWGQGNWQAYLATGRGARGQARPQENIDYVAQIGNDVALA